MSDDDDCDVYDCDDDDYNYGDDDKTPAPLFGCACEGALAVDTVCAFCIAYLQDQDAAPTPDTQSTEGAK